MASVAEQQSHKEKLDNARATRGHRRTQSNSQYEFTQLKVSTPSPIEELTEEAKRNKEEFNKIVEQNRIIGANLTQQALEAQKNSKEEKRTIIDCIEEDLVGVNSADKSTFAFGKKLCHGQKKRHNSDVVGALYRQSPLESGNSCKNGIDSCGIQKEEDDDESEDDFDSLFFAKYKKFGGAGRLTLPVGSGDGLSIIPELATDLVTSTEFGTSMFKDNNLANHNSNSNSLPTNNSNRSLPNNMDKALTSNSNNSTNYLGGKQCLTPQTAAVGVEHLPQINNLTQMNGNNKGEGNRNFEHKSDKNNKLDAPHNLPGDFHEFPQRTPSTQDNISIYNSTQNPSQSANPSVENEGFSLPPKKIKDSSASAALSSLVASLKNSQALNSNSNNSSNTCQNQIIQKSTQPTELDTAETQVSCPSRSPTVGQSATRPQHQRGESSLQFGQNQVQSFLSSNEGSQYNRTNKRNSIHEILGASNNLPSNASNMGNFVAVKNYSGSQLQQQPLEHHLNQQKNISQPRYTTQNSLHPSELPSIIEILPSPKDQNRPTGNNTSATVYPSLKSEKMLDSKENQLPQNHNHPSIHSNNTRKIQNPNFDNRIQQDSSVQPLSAKHPSNKSCTSAQLQVPATPQIISTSTAAANRVTNNKSSNQFQNAVTWLQHSSILPLASDKSSKNDIQEHQQQQSQQYQHSRTGSSSIVNVSNLVSSSTFSAHNYSNNHGASNNNLIASSILGSGYESNNNNNNCSNFNHTNYTQNNQNNNNNQRNLNNTSSSNSGSSSSSVLSPGIGDMDTQSKTYSQIIKDFLYKSNNSTTNSQYQQMHQEQLQQQAQYQQFSICTNNNSNNNKPTSSSKKISSLASKETKKPSPTTGIKQSTASTLSSNGNNSLEGRIFMLESKVLSLKCKTETLEKQNLNLTQEVMKISDEKEICLKENAESKQRLLELEGITRRNEESIQLIYKMLCKSQSDYELLRAQKTQQYQEASTNVFTDLSCIESPNEVRAGQKQILLPKNMNQIVEQQLSECNPYKNSHSAHSSNREKDGMKNNNNNSNLKMVSPQTYAQNSTKFHNENSSFNSLLQQRKHQSYKPQQSQQFQQYSPYQQQVLSNGNNGVNIYQNTNDGFKQGITSHSQYQPHRLM